MTERESELREREESERERGANTDQKIITRYPSYSRVNS